MADHIISADRIAEAERLVYKAWTAGGQENDLLEQAGRILYEEYMEQRYAGSDEMWRMHPSPYDPGYGRVQDTPKFCTKYGMNRKKPAGLYYTCRAELRGLSTESLAKSIRSGDLWDLGELRELCRRAGMLEEWIHAGCDTFEDAAGRAAERLGIDIGETGIPGTPNLSPQDILEACTSVMDKIRAAGTDKTKDK